MGWANLNLLSSSPYLLGRQIDALRAQVKIQGDNVTLSPFQFSNPQFQGRGQDSRSPISSRVAGIDVAEAHHSTSRLLKASTGLS